MAAPSRTRATILVVDDDRAGPARDRARPARPVRRDVPHRGGRRRRGGARGDRELTVRGAAIALFVVDQRMPRMTGIEFLLARRSSSSPTPGESCSPPTRIPRRRSRRSTRCASTTTSSSPGTRPRSASSRSSTTFWRTGRRRSGPPSRAIRLLAGRWAPRGHRDPRLPDAQPGSRTPGSTPRPMPTAARWPLRSSTRAHGGIVPSTTRPSRSSCSRTARHSSTRRRARSVSRSASRRRRRGRSTTWRSWAAGRPASRRRSTVRARG